MIEADWTIGESIALEMDVALSFAGGYLVPGDLSAGMAGWLHSLPADWLDQFPAMLGEPGRLTSVLEIVAYLARVLMEGDYSRATLAMRETTAAEAARKLADMHAGERGGLAGSIVRVKEAAYADIGLVQQETYAKIQRREAERAVDILSGGDLHERFWHWLDRFYYECYHPWRQGRLAVMEEERKKAEAALGGGETGSTRRLPVEWLPPTNPLLRHPELSKALCEGRLKVCFLTEPFGIPDAWTLWPGLLLTSFAQADEVYQKYRDFAVDVAFRVKALADPTRLTILRLIRHFGMINTEIAASLGLARPTVSVHAKILREAGLIRSRREERVTRHELATGELRRLFRDLERFLDIPGEEE